MRAKVPRDRRRPAGQHDDDLAFQIETGEVIGIVSSKLAPISQQTAQILSILEQQKFGMQYGATSADGKPINISEAQLVGAVLNELRRQVQLVIGKAVLP